MINATEEQIIENLREKGKKEDVIFHNGRIYMLVSEDGMVSCRRWTQIPILKGDMFWRFVKWNF